MRNKHIRQTQLILKIHHQVQHLSADGYIQRGYRFIGNHHIRIQHQPPGNGNTLALTAGKHMRITAVMLSFQADFRHHRQHFLFALCRAERGIDNQRLFQNLPDFFTRIKRAVRVLEHNLDFLPPQFLRMFICHQQILPLVEQLPAGRFFNHGQQTAECRFPAAGLPDHRQGFPAIQIKRYAVEGFHHPLRREKAFLHRIIFFQITDM